MYTNLEYQPIINTRPQLIKNFVNVPGNFPNLWRRPPIYFPRMPTMDGRFPNIGYRCFSPTINQPRATIHNGIIPDFRYTMNKAPNVIPPSYHQTLTVLNMPQAVLENKTGHYTLPTQNINGNLITGSPEKSKNYPGLIYPTNNQNVGIKPSTAQGPHAFCSPLNMLVGQSNPIRNPNFGIASSIANGATQFEMQPNVLVNQSNHYIVPATNINTCQTASQYNCHEIEQGKSNPFSQISVVSSNPSAGISDYNTRSCELNQNINTHILELNRINHLLASSQKSINFPIKNPCLYQQQQSANNTCVNAVYSNNVSMTARFMLVPLNVHKPLPANFSMTPTQNIHKNITNFGFMIPQQALPFSNFPSSLLMGSTINDCDPNKAQNLLSNKSIDEFNSNKTLDKLPYTKNYSIIHTVTNEPPRKSPPRYETMYSTGNLGEKCLFPNSIDNQQINDSQTQPNTDCALSSNMSFDNISNIKEHNEMETSMNNNIEANKCNVAIPTIPSSIPNSTSQNVTDMVISKDTDTNETEITNEIYDDMKIMVNQKTNSDNSLINESQQTPAGNLPSITKQIDKSRPASCTPIPDSSWCVVWTGDEKVFYYNTKDKISVWKRPTELLNRCDVEKLTEKPPFLFHSKSTENDAAENDYVVIKNLETYSETKENFEVKDTSKSLTSENNIGDNRKLMIEPNIECNASSHETKVKKFCDMLSENKVSVFSTWEKESNKFVFDSRFHLLPENERKQVFTEYNKRQIQEEINKSQKNYEIQKEEFLDLLLAAGVTNESVFSYFAQKYENDARFKAITNMKLKEKIFNDYVLELKKKNQEKERFEKLKKRQFIQLLSEKNCLNKKWPEVERALANEERFKVIHDKSLKKGLFEEFINARFFHTPHHKRQKRMV